MTDEVGATRATRLAEMLRDLVDALIPGEGCWPAASIVGVQGILAIRLLEALGEDALTQIDESIGECGGPLSACDALGRAAILKRLEEMKPKLFATLRTASYFAYYESPSVIVQVRTLGQPYDAIPIRRGYDVGCFDMDRDIPRHDRGRYVATQDVKRVDLSKLELSGGEHAASSGQD
jgi:hypothetical protein